MEEIAPMSDVMCMIIGLFSIMCMTCVLFKCDVKISSNVPVLVIRVYSYFCEITKISKSHQQTLFTVLRLDQMLA